MNIKKMGYVFLDYLKNKAKRDGIVQFLELHVYIQYVLVVRML